MLQTNQWRRYAKDFDYLVLILLMIISCFSLTAIYSATAHQAALSSIFPHEVVWQLMSYMALFVFVMIDYRNYTKMLPWIGYGISVFLCVIVFLFHAVKGAHSWIPMGSFQLQPSEFVKIFIILAISSYMSKQKEKEREFGWTEFVVITLVTFVPFVLVYKEPALGQALVILSIWGTLLLVFLKRKILIWILIILSLVIASFTTVVYVFPNKTIQFVEKKLPLKEYQKQRIVVFLDPSYDTSGHGFQVTQAKMAVASGEVFGRGLLKGSSTQQGWVPEQQTDFIFSAIGEELGFVGSSILIFCFFLMLFRMTRIAAKSEDHFAIFFIYGSMGMFLFQIFENIGMNLTITPSTGITLPFVSYGGSSLLTNFIDMGIALSIGMRQRKTMFGN